MGKALVNSVALTIKYFRKAKNMSQESLAEQAGLDRTYISGIERGTRNITLNSLEQVICALDIDIQTFFIKVFEELNQQQNQSSK